jgi:TRAP-type mannitol/chloroaromatic compound transport system substrate-binding protein
MNPADTAPRRRKFLKAASTAAVATGALAAPAISRAQTVAFRFQSTWPSKDIFHEYANDFAKKVNDMAGSRLKIEVLPSGSVVPAFQLLDADLNSMVWLSRCATAYYFAYFLIALPLLPLSQVR